MPAGFVISPSGDYGSRRPASAKNRLYLTAVCLVAGLGGFLFGFDTAVISGTILFLKNQYGLSSSLEGFVVSSGLVGCIAGSCCAGAISDRFGRKRILLLAAFLFLVCSIGCTVAGGAAGIIAFRFVGGIGVGLASMVSPLYIAEIAPPEIRGRMVSCYQFLIAAGVLAAYSSNALLLHLGAGWRQMFGAMAVPAIVFFVLMVFVPESPRWLVKRGLAGEAELTIAKISGAQAAKEEIAEISRAAPNQGGSFSLLWAPGLRRALAIGLLLPFFSQVSGVNVIIYYATSIFERSGLSQGSALGMQAIIGVVCVVCTLMAMWKVDRFGRKPMLLFGTGMILTTLLLIAAVFRSASGGSVLVLGLFCWYVAVFSAAFAPVMWVVISEIFPTRIRGRAMSLSTTSMWISCGLVAQTFPRLRDTLGTWQTFLVYAVLTAPSVILVWKVLPETKGQTLEQIEAHWATHRPRPTAMSP